MRLLLEHVSCSLCDGTKTRLRFRKFNSNFVQCRSCGLIYVTPRHPKEVTWLRYSAEYFEKEYLPAVGVVNGQFNLTHIDDRHAALLAMLDVALPGKGRLFELGAGAGLFLKAAERAGWQVSGVELSPSGVAFAQERLGLNVTKHSAETMPTDGEPYDVVAMFDVIEHLYDPVSALRQLRRICRPGGLIAVSTPNFDALSRLALGAHWSILSPLEHLYYFQESTLQKALEAAGFTQVKFEREHTAWDIDDTINARCTHKPRHWRAALYAAAVKKFGRDYYRRVQAAGRADILLAIARA